MDEAIVDWQTWFDRHGPALVLFARQRTNCYADAEDAVQAAFVRFWEHRAIAKNPLTYLYSCVANAAKDQHRSDARRHERERKAWFVKTDAEKQVGTEGLEHAMVTLPNEQREVLILKVWGGLTFKAVAEVLAIPANTAASRYRYGIEALKSELSQESSS